MSNIKMKDVPYEAVAEFCRRKGQTVPERFMTGWVYSVYINNKKEVDDIQRELRNGNT